MKPSYVSAEAASERGHLHVPHNVLLVLTTHLPASPLYFLHPVVRPSVIAHSHLRRERAARRSAHRLPFAKQTQHLHKWRQIVIPLVAKVSRMLQSEQERIWWVILTVEVDYAKAKN